jgi:hypothetical protein
VHAELLIGDGYGDFHSDSPFCARNHSGSLRV